MYKIVIDSCGELPEDLKGWTLSECIVRVRGRWMLYPR